MSDTPTTVWFSAQGRLDKIGLLRSITKKDASRYFIWLVEEMARTIAETKLHGGKGASQQTVIFDMEVKNCPYTNQQQDLVYIVFKFPSLNHDIVQGLSLRQMLHKPGKTAIKFYCRTEHDKKDFVFSAVEVELMALRLFESNYPENLRRAFVINGTQFLLIVCNQIIVIK